MIKLFAIVCDNQACRKVITDEPVVVTGKKRKLHFCNVECSNTYYTNKYKNI